MKICPVLAGSQQFYKFFINYILRSHVKTFFPARQDPSVLLSASRFVETKPHHVIAYAHLSEMKKFINKSV